MFFAVNNNTFEIAVYLLFLSQIFSKFFVLFPIVDDLCYFGWWCGREDMSLSTLEGTKKNVFHWITRIKFKTPFYTNFNKWNSCSLQFLLFFKILMKIIIVFPFISKTFYDCSFWPNFTSDLISFLCVRRLLTFHIYSITHSFLSSLLDLVIFIQTQKTHRKQREFVINRVKWH